MPTCAQSSSAWRWLCLVVPHMPAFPSPPTLHMPAFPSPPTPHMPAFPSPPTPQTGDKWCLCASRWAEAYDEGVACSVVLKATHIKALDVCDLSALIEHALDPPVSHTKDAAGGGEGGGEEGGKEEGGKGLPPRRQEEL